MYKAIRVDAKSEFAYEGQKLGQRSLSAKMRKKYYCKTIYLFICKYLSFQTKFCMLIAISLKNIEKMFYITKCSYVDFKMGSKVIKCNNRSIFTNCVSFFLWCNNKMLFKLWGRSLSEGLN